MWFHGAAAVRRAASDSRPRDHAAHPPVIERSGNRRSREIEADVIEIFRAS